MTGLSSAEKRELEMYRRQVDEFRHLTSHDLKSPARLVGMYLQLLSRRCGDQLDATSQEFLQLAASGARRLNQMFEALDTLVRLTPHEPPRPVDLNVALEKACKRLTLRIASTGATLTNSSLPLVSGHLGPLSQLFHSLLENSLAHRSSAPPRIHIEANTYGEWWWTHVHDNGPGIPEEDRERAFRLFHRLNPAADCEAVGAGLAFCRKIVEIHGGEIRIAESPLGGTCVSFSVRSA